MSVVTTVKLSDLEAGLIKKYAKDNGVTMTEFLKQAVKEKIENEEDIKDYKEWIEKEKRGETKYHTLEEVKKELGL